MIGVAIIVVVLLIAIPVGVLVSGAVGAGIIGHFLRADADASHEGSELLDLHR